MEGSDTTTPAAEATYYCPQCGARYSGPGLCENGHGPAEVVALDPAAAAEDGTAAATAPAPPAADETAALDGGAGGDAAAIIAGIRDALDHLEQLVAPAAAQ